MKKWQRDHLQQKRHEQIQRDNYEALIERYAEYFYKANIELYAVERALHKSQFSLTPIKDLYNIMESDDIFKDDLYKPSFKTKDLKIPSDTHISECVRKNISESIGYTMCHYFLSKKNPGFKFFYHELDSAIEKCNLSTKRNYKALISGLLLLTSIFIGIYLCR